MSVYGHDGTCRRCLKKRVVFGISRKGAGAYNRAQRHYRSSICGECAQFLWEYAQNSHGLTYSGWDIHGLRRIVQHLDPPEAPTVPENVPTPD